MRTRLFFIKTDHDNKPHIQINEQEEYASFISFSESWRRCDPVRLEMPNGRARGFLDNSPVGKHGIPTLYGEDSGCNRRRRRRQDPSGERKLVSEYDE